MTEDINSYKFSSIIARFADNKKAKNIAILNISNVSTLSDYFVICSADSPTQVKALTSNIRVKVKELFNRIPVGDETDSKNRWNLLDYGDVVVHILQTEERETYAIEKFWNHACKIDEDSWMSESQDYENELL